MQLCVELHELQFHQGFRHEELFGRMANLLRTRLSALSSQEAGPMEFHRDLNNLSTRQSQTISSRKLASACWSYSLALASSCAVGWTALPYE